jgi:hypothetical protein
VTLLEIYNLAASLVYGDIEASPPPDAEIVKIRSFILQRHDDVQTGYNYWFAETDMEFPLTEGVKIYTWPADFKELRGMDLKRPFFWTATGFKLTAAPDEGSTFPVTYWKRFTVTAWDDDYEDDVTIYLNWEIIIRLFGDMFLSRSNQSEAMLYYQKADDTKYRQETKDYEKRQSQRETF